MYIYAECFHIKQFYFISRLNYKKNMYNFDLHIHSTLSDGELSPFDIVQMAKRNNVKILAITDHDIVSEKNEIIPLLKKHSIEFLHGVEINCSHKSLRLEVLGYNIDPSNKKLSKKLQEMRNYREKRAKLMIKKLKDKGFEISVERVSEISGYGTIGRPHIAKALLEQGYVKSLNEAFRKYLGDNSPYYVKRMKLEAAEAIALIRDAGGIPVHSHPGFFKTKNIKNHLIELKKLGLMGVEVFYPYPAQLSLYNSSRIKLTPKKYEKYLLSLCEELDLIPTGGTDFHGGESYEKLLKKISHGFEKVAESGFLKSCI
ncbi:MAG: PHP domain-containing protein [Candidatus Schekmanbacteria bacterium]|nr:MAG: PHP domain-containing protein [Candidatus Schekmanbacteria bacterium]